ncbi:MAG: hypothetical protein U0931_28935 [Vulcanimicrobiota bacterium]
MAIKGARAAVSLIELSTSSVLLLLVLSLIWMLTVQFKAYLDNAQGRIQLQGEVLKGMRLISAELAESNRFTVDCRDQSLLFASPRNSQRRVGFDSQGRILWPKRVCYLVLGSELWRRELAIEPPSPEPPLPSSQLNLLQDAPDPRKIAVCVVSLQSLLGADGNLEYTIRGQVRSLIHTYAVEAREKVVLNN